MGKEGVVDLISQDTNPIQRMASVDERRNPYQGELSLIPAKPVISDPEPYQ